MNPITLTQAAADLGVSRQTVFYHIKQGHLPAFKIGYILAIRPEIWQEFKRAYQAGGFPPGRPEREYIPRWRLQRREVAK